MSNLSSYPIRSFSETQQFLVNDPATGTASRVRASDLVAYITPRLNSVIAESTRLAAENTDYAVGEIIQTSGATSPGDNFAAVYLVVAAGEGDFPMINGNELLVIRGDEFLREQLISEDAGEGASLVSMEGGPTVETAVNNRVIRVSSRTEMKAYDVGAGYQFSFEGFNWIVKSGAAPADTQEGVYVVLANGNYAERQSNDGYFPVSAWGADPNAADNTSALRAAIESGFPIDWGSEEYQVQGRVGADSSISHAIRWKSNGAKVFLDPAVSNQEDLIAYRVQPLDHVIDGKLIIDASLKATIGFGIRNIETINYPSSFGTFLANEIEIKNVRKTTDGFRAGDGIRIEGCFLWVVLNNPTVTNCRLEAGAGVPGLSGITGISITRDGISGGYALYVEINNPSVDGVESEDLTYEDDQDGIQIFGANTLGQRLSGFLINGGSFTNCFGRSIKSQMPAGRVTGATFKRDRGFTSGVGNPEIDFQGGMGFVEDITVDYDGFVPSVVVSQRSTDLNRSQGDVSGVQFTVKNATLPGIVATFSSPPVAPVIARNISGTGSLDYVSLVRAPQAVTRAYLENIEVETLNEGLAQCVTGGIGIDPAEIVIVEAKNCINNGLPVRALHQRIPGNAVSGLLSADNLVGFTGDERSGSTASEADGPAITKYVESLAFSGSGGGESPLVNAVTKFIANGATEIFPNPGVGLAFFISNFSHNTQGVFSYTTASGGRLLEFFSGPDVSIGVASKPATNTFLLWPDTANTELTVENNSGSTRVVSILYIGGL